MHKAMVEMEDQSKSEQPPLTILPSKKKKRNLPGMPDPDAEVIALSPGALLATNRFVCEICNKGFQRDQNLQLHRRGHNLPWKLKQRNSKDAAKKRVYVCPEITCVHHEPSRALGDLTGIKKHFSRKHGEKKYKCERCTKKYAVQSDWKAHVKTCGTREYPCDCGTLFSRRDSFITHRAFCDALAQESARSQPQSEATGDLSARIITPPPPTAPAAASPPPPPLTPSAGVLSPVMSIQSSELPENQLPPPPPPPPQASTITATTTTSSSSTTSGTDGNALTAKLNSSTSELSQSSRPQLSSAPYSNLLCPLSVSGRASIDPMSLSLSSSTSFYEPPSSLFPVASSSQNPPQPLYLSRPQPALSATALLQKAAQMGSTSSKPSFLRCLGLALPSSSGPENNWNNSSVTIDNSSFMASGFGIGLPSAGSSSLNELMMDPSSIFGDRPPTLDFLGLGMRGGEPSSEGLSAFLSSISGDDNSAGGMWDGSCDRKPSVL